MTTSRMVVVLRSALGRQQSRAQKELDEIVRLFNESKEGTPEELKLKKEMSRLKGSVERLQSVTHMLGGLSIGDIDDEELN